MSVRPVAYCIAITLLSAAAYASDRDAELGADRSKPAREYKLKQVSTPDNPLCEPTFAQVTETRRINASGRIVGWHRCWQSTGNPEVPFVPNTGAAFLWSPRTGPLALPAIDGDSLGTFGRDLNDAGVAVGWDFTALAGVRGVMWPPAGGATYVLDVDQCSFFTLAEGINNRGSIAARTSIPQPDGSCPVHWILKLASGEEIVGPVGAVAGLNNRNVLIGTTNFNAAKWSQAGGEVVLAPGTGSPTNQYLAFDINGPGAVVGDRRLFSDDLECVIGNEALHWNASGALQTLPLLRGDVAGAALGINDHSLIVGRSGKPLPCGQLNTRQQRAVIWHKGRVTNLNKLLKPRDARRVKLLTASSINEHGQISAIGMYRDEAPKPCWDWVFDPQTGERTYDNTRTCQSTYAFQLTPVVD